mgnify:CR=1 FL=1
MTCIENFDDGTKISKDIVISLFNLPINDAASSLGICATKLKKICRFYNIKRWPYRKFKTIDELITNYIYLRESGNMTEEEISELNISIEKLEKDKEMLKNNCNTKLATIVPKIVRNKIKKIIMHKKNEKIKNKKYVQKFTCTKLDILSDICYDLALELEL